MLDKIIDTETREILDLQIRRQRGTRGLDDLIDYKTRVLLSFQLIRQYLNRYKGQ